MVWMMLRWGIAGVLMFALAGCATTRSFNKPGFHTEVRDGRLWVFRPGSPELAEFMAHGEVAKQVTRIGAGPDGMTIKSSDAQVIDDYLAAKSEGRN